MAEKHEHREEIFREGNPGRAVKRCASCFELLDDNPKEAQEAHEQAVAEREMALGEAPAKK